MKAVVPAETKLPSTVPPPLPLCGRPRPLERSPSLEDLERHREEPLHLVATKEERKVSTCNLCKKQFTSPPQLKVSRSRPS